MGDAEKTSLLSALHEDCLVELLARCPASDMLSLAKTCKDLARVVSARDGPWRARLSADFGLEIKALPDSPGALPLSIFARRVYEAGRQSLRFQAALVTGGVDGEELRYWADNMFLPTAGHRYYCSNCSANADCVALLLDGPVVREDSYNAAMHYIRRRCRYGAAVLANQDDPEQAMQDDDVLSLVERWDDEEVERFFQGLVQLLDEHQHWGRLLLSDIPPERHAEERERINAVSAYLRSRLAQTQREMLKQPNGNIWFDASLMPKLDDPLCHRLAGVINEVTLSRAGSLTCPVLAGAVIAGTIDFSRLQGRTPAQVAELLHGATQHPACAALNSLETLTAVNEAVAEGKLPGIVAQGVTSAARWVEFERLKAASEHAASGVAAADLVSWAPLIWYKFHTAEEAQQLAAAAAGGQSALAAESSSSSSSNSDAEGSEGGASEAQSEESGGGDAALFAAMLDSEDEEMGDDEDELASIGDRIAGRELLTVPLSHPCGANALCVKLINQENLMEELDPHDWPNIDVNYVNLVGKLARLPPNFGLHA